MRVLGLDAITLVHVGSSTGAAPAFAGYLRDLDWPHENRIRIIECEDMGARSVIEADFTDEPGSSIRLSGVTRRIA